LQHYPKPFVIVMATGAGKSLVIADICHQIDEPILILQPNKEILEQNYQKLLSYGFTDVGIYSASKGRKEIEKFTYATIGSIYKKPELFMHFKYVIIDECHLVNPKNLGGMYTSFLKAIDCKHVCGLTATPYRLVPKYFKRGKELYYTTKLEMINRIHPFFFAKFAYKIETQDLIDQKFLSPIEYFAEEEDLSSLQVNSTGADYTAESLERFWGTNRMERLSRIIQHIDKTSKKNLVFCSSILAANKAQAMLKAMGIRAEVVTGGTPAKEREAIINEYRTGDLKHIINVNVFTTGFDVPELDSVVLARPTMSLALYYQMVGRGVRLDPNNEKKVLKVYDLAGVVERLGKVETIRLEKEDGYKDCVGSEAGRMTGVPLFTFHVKKKMFQENAKLPM
jgi:DNA repair protein RadD